MVQQHDDIKHPRITLLISWPLRSLDCSIIITIMVSCSPSAHYTDLRNCEEHNNTANKHSVRVASLYLPCPRVLALLVVGVFFNFFFYIWCHQHAPKTPPISEVHPEHQWHFFIWATLPVRWFLHLLNNFWTFLLLNWTKCHCINTYTPDHMMMMMEFDDVILWAWLGFDIWIL